MTLLPRRVPDSLEVLTTLALDLRWTSSAEAAALWRAVDAEVWQRTQNPWFLLQDVPEQRLEELASDAAFLERLRSAAAARRASLAVPTRLANLDGAIAAESIGYFSMEFGLSEALPLYAGGLGILAGDHLKTASDLGLSLTGVGILFQEGYFRQAIDAWGHQTETYPYNDPTALPIQPVTASSGAWLRVPVELPGRTLWLRVWRAVVGRVDLFLLDSNEPLNGSVDRGITSKLYGGGSEARLLQELVLGIGGWRALVALGRTPTVAHLNEGHAAFVVLERARHVMAEHRLSFHDAWWIVRAGNVFTTHTPVAAGFDAFAPEQMAQYFAPDGSYLHELGITLGELMALGRAHPHDAGAPFNMAYLALHGSARTNAVSELHGAVSRALFAPAFPRWPEAEVPVAHVTNGVHVPTWISASADSLWKRALGPDAWTGSLERHAEALARVSDEELWGMRQVERAALVAYARERLAEQLARRGTTLGASELGDVLDPSVLTLGFARRFAEYKRPHLLLRDPERLTRLLTDRARPVQIVIAGKAHPADDAGKRFVTDWLDFVARSDVRMNAVFLEDYDMALAGRLVAGVDVWLNTPRRPWEACGTSGMKVLANGGLNLSERDGWWAEAFSPKVGWALSGTSTDDDRDARDLFDLLEREIAPAFYERDTDGLPRRWLEKLRASMATLATNFSSVRMAREYTERCYAPAAAEHRARSLNDAALAKDLGAWATVLETHWNRVRLFPKWAIPRDGGWEFTVEVRVDGLPHGVFRVELYADGLDGSSPIVEPMHRVSPAGASDPLLFSVTLATRRPPEHFTPRVVPHHPRARVPAEMPLIAWAEGRFAAG